MVAVVVDDDDDASGGGGGGCGCTGDDDEAVESHVEISGGIFTIIEMFFLRNITHLINQ